MSNKLTIVKVLAKEDDGHVTARDLERWRTIFANHRMTEEEATATGDVIIEHIAVPEDADYITLVKVGNDDYKPSYEDLEAWRRVFENAVDDPDFKIFTHPGVEIDVIQIGKIVAVE